MPERPRRRGGGEPVKTTVTFRDLAAAAVVSRLAL
jgi:hypothetical protein